MSDIKYYIRFWNEDYEYAWFAGRGELGSESTDDIEGFDSMDEAYAYMREKNLELGPEGFIVMRGRYKDDDVLDLVALHWNEDRKTFMQQNVQAKFSENYLTFTKRTFDHWGIHFDFIGRVVGPGCQCGAGMDYNAVFCWPDKAHIWQAKKELQMFYRSKASRLQEELSEIDGNLKAIAKVLYL